MRNIFSFVGTFAIITALLAGNQTSALATGTHFDLSFDSNGFSNVDFGFDDIVWDAALQPDGKVVVVGSTGPAHQLLALARYNSSGSLDTSFDGDGRVTVSNPAMSPRAVAVQSNGKIVVAGGARDPSTDQSDFALLRFNTNGSIDTTFGTGGLAVADAANNAMATSAAGELAIQSDGKIIAVGYAHRPNVAIDFAAARFTTTGSLDGTFGSGGVVSTDFGAQDSDQAYGVAVMSNGKILVAGSTSSNSQDGALARYNANGSLDTSFGGGDGLVTTDFAGHHDGWLDLKLQSDGKIVAAGAATLTNKSVFALARFNVDGSSDTSFDGDGKVTTDATFFLDNQIYAIALQSDGKIVAVGQSVPPAGIADDFTLARYNPNGTLDAAFGRAGLLHSDLNNGSDDSASSIAIQPDGKLVVAGQTRAAASGSPSDFAVARYWPNMNPRFDFDGDSYGDMSVVRGPNFNTWYLLKSSSGSYSTTFGLPTDRLTPADYDGDGICDIGIYRPSTGTWYWIRSSSNSFTSTQFGVQEDLPTPADYDGDGKADLSVYRPSAGTWYRLNSSNGAFFYVAFGASNDKPTIGDFDGDGRADIATYRPSNGTWYRLNSSDNAFVQTQFGLSNDRLAPGDYDGDGKTDLAVYRFTTNTWYLLNSSNGAVVSYQFGASFDIPAVSDFDRDGRDDVSLFRPSTGIWYRINSFFNTFVGQHYGMNGDAPIPAAFNY